MDCSDGLWTAVAKKSMLNATNNVQQTVLSCIVWREINLELKGEKKTYPPQKYTW